ncbi:MAG: preprotein translocase subunit SecG [Kiritimatiellia bacterium]
MEYLKVLLYIVEVVVCLMLGLVVMLQKPKEGGLGGAFGGGALEASLGADAGNVLIKATATLGAIFLLNTLALARLTAKPESAFAKVSEGAAEAGEAAPAAGDAAAEPVPAP